MGAIMNSRDRRSLSGVSSGMFVNTTIWNTNVKIVYIDLISSSQALTFDNLYIMNIHDEGCNFFALQIYAHVAVLSFFLFFKAEIELKKQT